MEIWGNALRLLSLDGGQLKKKITHLNFLRKIFAENKVYAVVC